MEYTAVPHGEWDSAAQNHDSVSRRCQGGTRQETHLSLIIVEYIYISSIV